MLHVAFFWHMHQPYYRNPLTGEYSLPWVRLHALKGYFDMISLLEDYPFIPQTFNLVPSLIRQLTDYARGEAWDVFLEYTRKPAEELSPEEKKFILANFFMRPWETMINPHPGDRLVVITLDGENLWEYYPDGGQAFLSALPWEWQGRP